MTESMTVEAIRAAGANGLQPSQVYGPQSVAATADPSAVDRFQAAMAVDPIPFASQVSASWRAAHANNQGLLHRIRALTEMKAGGNVAAAELVELQYEVMNLSFQQEVVTKVADKSSNTIQTLVKNQ